MKKQADIALLLTVLVLLSASIGILHGRKMGAKSAAAGQDTLILLEHQDALDYVQPYLMSGNMDSTAAILHQFAEPVLFKTLDAILNDEITALSNDQKIKLLASVLLYEKDNALHQKKLLDRISLFPNEPIFAAMLPHYKEAIAHVLEWAKKGKKKKIASRWANLSIDDAFKKDDPEFLSALLVAGIRPDKGKASKLLFQVVAEDKQPAFIPLLVQQLKADINFSPDGMRTPLIKAVEDNNLPLVQALVEHGADPELVLSPKIGNARQVAFERGYTPIELLLKK